MRRPRTAHRRHFLVLGLALGLAGCGGQPTPAPTAGLPTPTEASGGQMVVDRDVVKYREHETDELAVVEAGESQAVVPGGNVVVDDRGRATLTWEAFLENTLLQNDDMLVSLSEPSSRRAILDQAAGVGRYEVQGDGEPTDLQVNAGYIGVGKSVALIHVALAPADFVVSIEPGDKPTVWVVVRDGSAEVTRGSDKVTLTEDQVGAFTEDGPLPTPQSIDGAVFRTWLDAVVDGKGPGSISTVAFRCIVTADQSVLHATPSATGKPMGIVTKGSMVTVAGRSADNAFLEVTEDGKTLAGWIAAADVACAAPISSAPLVLPGMTATPTRTGTRPPARVTATRTPTARGSGTPTPTGTATLAAFIFDFGVSPSSITAGDCATLAWNVEGVQSVYLDGSGVAGGKQSKKVCPDETTTYTMEVVLADGTKQSKSVTLKVTSGAPTSPPVATGTTPPTAPPFATETPVPPTPKPEDTSTPVPPADTDTPEPPPTVATP